MRNQSNRCRLASTIAALVGLAPAITRSLAGDGYECCRDERGWAGAQQAFDAATGKSLRNYPPARPADFLHMRLELSIADMNRPSLEGVARYTIRPIGYELAQLSLDARMMSIRSVECSGRKASFSYDSRTIKITLDPPLKTDEVADLTVNYSLIDPAAGIIWTPESAAWPGRAAQLHTQGEPEFASYWFPCHEFPNERLTTELIVTVPAGYQVSSNGRLAARSKGVAPSSDAAGKSRLQARETWRWVQDDSAGGDHVNYLVSLVVGKFDVVDVSPSRDVPMPVYTPRGRGDDVQATYGKTPDILRAFQNILDERYPWSRYAQLVVWNFGSGGMENTGCTSMYDTALIEKSAVGEYDLDGLIAHELAHQWFGDLITCNSWEHIWLNEGFASYMEALWLENERPGRAGRDAYDADILSDFDSVVQGDKADAPHQPAMVSKVYRHPRETFRKAASPYSKGASVLHMLRREVGDGAFFAGLRAYVSRFKHRTVETDQFRQVMEEASGESLERFFAQWCMRPGVPLLNVSLEWEESDKSIVAKVEQSQKIDGDNPAFEFSLPILVLGSSGEQLATFTLPCDSKAASARFELASRPAGVAVDPELTLLAGMKIAAPADWLARCAEAGPTYGSRIRAIRAIGATESGSASALLVGIARNGRESESLRIQTIHCLETRKDADALGTLATEELTPSKVRAAALLAFAKVASAMEGDAGQRQQDRAKTLCEEAMSPGLQQRIRVSAAEALGVLKAAEKSPFLVAATKTESHDDLLRQAAVTSLAEIGGRENLEIVIGFTLPGHLCRTRAEAASKLSLLAPVDKDRVVTRLTELLSDSEFRVRMGACDALTEIKDERCINALRGFSESARSDYDRYRGLVSLEKLRESMKPDAPKTN